MLSGHDVTLLSGNRAPNTLDDPPIKCLTIPEATNKLARKAGLDYVNPPALIAFKKIIDTIRPDIIHFHSLYGLSTALVWVATKRYPVFVTLHDTWLAFTDASIVSPRLGLANSYYKVPHGFIHRAINKFFVKKATIISPSIWMKEYFETTGFQSPIHIHNGIEPRGRRTTYHNTILWVGSLSTFKGLPSVIDALSTIVTRTGWRFVVVGDGPRKCELEKKYPMVDFVGFQDPEWYYSRASILIVSSIGYENFPTVILEAMQHGLCVIGHGIGGISELIRHNETGILYHSSSSLATSLLTLIADPRKLYRLGGAARATFYDNYLWETCYNSYLKLYT